MEREKVEHQLRTQYCDCCHGQQGLHSAGASEEHRMSSSMAHPKQGVWGIYLLARLLVEG